MRAVSPSLAQPQGRLTHIAQASGDERSAAGMAEWQAGRPDRDDPSRSTG